MRTTGLLILALALAYPASAEELRDGYWSEEQVGEILDVTLRLRLDPDLSHLTDAERAALPELLAAGRVMNDLYETQKHAEALDARRLLESLRTEDQGQRVLGLIDLYYMSKGPVATTLDNQRLPFLPVGDETDGKNVYPRDLSRTEIDAFVAANPEDSTRLKSERHVVRRVTADDISADLAMLDAHPGVDALHPALRSYLESKQSTGSGLYAVPYALAYAPQLAVARAHLEKAAAILADGTPDFADYLRLRARDFLSSDYEASDAAWVSGTFGNLNMQIGSYETYDDSLLGVKAFFSASLLARDPEKSAALERAVAGLQSIEDALPYDSNRTVRSNIPVGAYNIVADFGQARGTNTATILPNDADHTRKYGRTILVRYNILANPELFDNRTTRYAAVVATDYRDHLTMDGGFDRTLWHEVGHYLGVDKTADGVSLDEALADYADLLEEMKSDLVSLFAAPALRAAGYYDDDGMRAHYADGIRRTLQTVRPRPTQPYQNMQLMQFNYFMENGLIEPQADTGLLMVHYDRYHETATELLRQVLEIQRSGDRALARDFVNRWNYWDERLHGEVAADMRESMKYRRSIVKYAALGD